MFTVGPCGEENFAPGGCECWASRSGRFPFDERARVARCIEGRVGYGFSLIAEDKGKLFCPCHQESITDSLAISTQLSLYGRTPAPSNYCGYKYLTRKLEGSKYVSSVVETLGSAPGSQQTQVAGPHPQGNTGS